MKIVKISTLPGSRENQIKPPSELVLPAGERCIDLRDHKGLLPLLIYPQ